MICPRNLKARGVFLSHAGEGILIREKPRGLQGREGHFFSLPQDAPPAVIHAQSTAGVLSCPPLKCPGRHQHTFTCEHIFKGLSWPMDLKKKKKKNINKSCFYTTLYSTEVTVVSDLAFIPPLVLETDPVLDHSQHPAPWVQ